MSPSYGVIARVDPGSIADDLGLQAGDQVISINGHALRDLIDYRFYGADEELEILVRRGDEDILFEIERDFSEDLGIEFAELTFDGIRRCTNNCSFCFIKGMPPGLRRSLYIKDDDYRYAFLAGNFITLSNLTARDWKRIDEQHLSPLYVSVHATDPELRRRLLGNPKAPDILPQLRRLRDLGIEVHTQVVLTPGENDGPHLAQTASDLAELWPAVRSVGIVPVGLTRYQQECGRTYRPEEAGPVLDQVQAWQKKYRRLFGLRWVYASDEWYLLDGRPVPSAAAYDGFPQLENGIGLVRQLLDDWARVRKRRRPSRASEREGRGEGQDSGPITLVCGTLIAPVLERLAEQVSALVNVPVQVLPVINAFFGEQVTVSGLLTGRDVRRALEQTQPTGPVYLPRAMFDSTGERTLDDLTLADIGAGLPAQLQITGRLSEVVRTGF